MQPFGVAVSGIVLARNIDAAVKLAAKEYPTGTVTVWSIGEFKPGAYRRLERIGDLVQREVRA